jgi:hypothetical protein
MARGWESKSVEAQQDAAVEKATKGPQLTPADSARMAERATLLLARTRALADLQMACAAAHRAMLEQAIADLDQRLSALEKAAST